MDDNPKGWSKLCINGIFSNCNCIYLPSSPIIWMRFEPDTPSERLTSTVAFVSKDSDKLQQAAFLNSPCVNCSTFLGSKRKMLEFALRDRKSTRLNSSHVRIS